MKLKFPLLSCILLISLGCSFGLFASGIKYPFDDIPKSLLKDAKAVVRNEVIVVEINSNNKLVQKVTYAITILNKNGKSNGYFMHPYDKNMKVSGIKAQMFDKNGIEIKKKGGFDILDYAMIPQGSTYGDLRIKAIDPENFEYPYTVEYTYEVTFTEVIQYPGWYPVRDFNISVERSKFNLIVAEKASCRYYEKNLISKVTEFKSAVGNHYTWELSNMPAYADESFCPALSDFTPVVLIAPSKVKVEGYEGNFETWSGFGQWINQLSEGRNNLSPETRAKIKKIASGYPDEHAKIKALYEYMQNKTRYVSIQVGIGGFQPFDAETVDRLSYGDCKALSYYMKSILEVAGIGSRYTLVQAGKEKPTIHANFPSNQFNHVILCVPLATDTVWLECTDQSGPFNYLGTFTAGRKVLVMEDQGGKLINTPDLKPAMNLRSGKVEVTLDPEGNGFALASIRYYGATYDEYRQILMSDQSDRKKLVTRRIHIPNFELDNFNITETKNEIPFVTERLNLTINSYPTRVGEKMMLCLNMMNKMSESPFQSTTRKTPVSFKWPVYEIDTVTYTLPQGYAMEKIPSKISIASDFGTYTTIVTKTGSMIQYVRTFEIYKGKHPVEQYDDIVTFFDKVVTADENKVMLTRIM